MIALAELVEIRCGYPLRGKVKTGAEGDICLLQSKDVLAGSGNAGLMRASIPALPAHHFLQTGDLVLLARGARSPARVIADPAPRTICIAPLMHVRILDATILLPQYLAWLINLEETQQTLRAMARGSLPASRHCRRCRCCCPAHNASNASLKSTFFPPKFAPWRANCTA